MKKIKNIMILLIIFIIVGVISFINFYKPYDKDKEMYKVLSGKHFNYYSYTKDNLKDIKELNRYIDSVYYDFENKLGVNIGNKIDVMIYKESNDLTSDLYLGAYEKLKPLGLANRMGIYIVENQEGYDIREIFRHELIHKLTFTRNIATENPAYEWLLEGVAYYYTYIDNNKNYRANNALRVAAFTNNLPDLDKILKNSSSVTDEWGYDLYRSIVEFIISEYGNDKLLEVIDNVGVKDVKATINLSEEEFIEKWKNFMIEKY